MFQVTDIAELLQVRISHALEDPVFQRDLAEEGEALWFLYDIANAAQGIYQYETICEELAQEPSDDYYVDTSVFDEQLTAALNLPPLCSVYLGYWPYGGCFGVILKREKYWANPPTMV